MTKKAKTAAKRKPAAGSTQSAVARHLDCTQPRVHQLVQEGVFERLPDGSLDIDACRVRFIRWLRDETRRSSSSEEAKRYHAAKTRALEMRTAREMGKLVEVDDAITEQSEILNVLNNRLIGVPAACTRDLELRRVIEDQIEAALAGCRAEFERLWRRLESGQALDDDGDDADAR